MTERPNSAQKRQQYDADNLQAARLILADTDYYGGDQSLAVRRARARLTRYQSEQDRERGRLRVAA